MNEEQLEKIQKNYEKFYKLCDSLGDRSKSVTDMIDEISNRIALCPASAKEQYHNSFPGGLVDHSLRVLSNLIKLDKTYDWKLPKDSMIICALFHDIGKLGMPGESDDNDFYQQQDDQWLVEKRGMLYKYNETLTYMTTPDRSVFFLQHYGIKLNPDEWLAIKLNDGFVLQENKPYCLKIKPLVYGLMTSDYIATCQEKEGNAFGF